MEDNSDIRCIKGQTKKVDDSIKVLTNIIEKYKESNYNVKELKEFIFSAYDVVNEAFFLKYYIEDVKERLISSPPTKEENIKSAVEEVENWPEWKITSISSSFSEKKGWPHD